MLEIPGLGAHAASLAIILLLSVALHPASGARYVQTAMPEGASRVIFSCDSSSWIKEDLNKVDTVLSLGTNLAPDVPGGPGKYRLTREGKELTILNLQTSDSGVFKCKNFKYSLTVAPSPTCDPMDATFKEGVEQAMTCGNIFSNPAATSLSEAGAPPRVEWLVDEEVTLSKDPTEYLAAAAEDVSAGEAVEEDAGETARRTALPSLSVDFSLVPKFSDNGKRLRCVLNYEHWNASFPKPSCGIDKLDVKFEPRVECPRIQYLNENNSRHEAFCEILGNPRPSEDSIFWKTDNNDRIYLSRRDGRKQAIKDLPYGIRSSIFLTQSLINQNMTVNVPFGGKIMSHPVAPILVSGPYLTCPRTLKIRRDNQVEVGCEIRTEPVIPAGNITWTVKGEKPELQKTSNLEKTGYGQDISMLFDLAKYSEQDNDEIRITVQVTGIFVTAKKEVTVVLRDSVSVEETMSHINDWVNQNAGLLLLSGALFLMGLLTFVVIVVAYRKGFLCERPQDRRYNRPMNHNARLPSAALLDALNDLEYKAARGTNTMGNRRSSFTFYGGGATGTASSSSQPLTIGRDSVDNFEWSHGFSKLANALIAKDTDQDGYIQSHDAIAAVKTYSQIYKLKLDESVINNAMTTCSNGAHVDVESLTRLLANAHDAQA